MLCTYEQLVTGPTKNYVGQPANLAHFPLPGMQHDPPYPMQICVQSCIYLSRMVIKYQGVETTSVHGGNEAQGQDKLTRVIFRCRACMDDDSTVCAACSPGFLMATGQSECLPACLVSTTADGRNPAFVHGCVSCDISLGGNGSFGINGRCSQCRDGYALENDGRKCVPGCLAGPSQAGGHNVERCASCSLSDPLRCASCVIGFTPNNNGTACISGCLSPEHKDHVPHCQKCLLAYVTANGSTASMLASSILGRDAAIRTQLPARKPARD